MGLAGEQLPRWMLPWSLAVAAARRRSACSRSPAPGPRRLPRGRGRSSISSARALASFRVEGRRRAIDRLATTAVYSALRHRDHPARVGRLATVISKGAKVLNANLPHPLAARHRPARHGRRHLPRHHRQPRESRSSTSLIAIPIALARRRLPGRVRPGRPRQAGDVLRRRDDRHPVDRRRPVHLRRLDPDPALPALAASLRPLALSILMIPVVVRSTEEMLKLVPNELRESSLALGVPRWRTILKVVIPTALAGHHHGHHAGCRPRHRRDGTPAAAHRLHHRSTRTCSPARMLPCPRSSTTRLSARARSRSTAPGARRSS